MSSKNSVVMIHYICEKIFDKPHKKNKDYSLTEVSIYRYIPYGQIVKNIKDHMLKIRKNLKTNKFEIIKVFNGLIEQEEVYYKSQSFRKVLDKATELYHLYWGKCYKLLEGKEYLKEYSQCKHSFNKRALHCQCVH